MQRLKDEDAADVVFQEFSLRFVRGDFGNVDPARGRFRSYVKTVIYHLIVDHQRRRSKDQRISPLPDDSAGAGEDKSPDIDATFIQSWRDELLDRCWSALREEEALSGPLHYSVLRYRADNPNARSTDVAAWLTGKFGKETTSGAARVMLHRARERFADQLLGEVIHSLNSPERHEIEQELIDLNLIHYCRPALDRRKSPSNDSTQRADQ